MLSWDGELHAAGDHGAVDMGYCRSSGDPMLQEGVFQKAA